jgi:hypothetical protein
MDASVMARGVDRYREDVVDNALEFLDKYMLSQADPDGKPNHGRDYDRAGTKGWLLDSDPNIIAKILALPLAGELKADIIMMYIGTVNISNKLHDTTALDELLAYIESVGSSAEPLPNLPVWCTPTGVKLFNLKSAVRTHYQKRDDAIMALYNSSSDTDSMYNFLLNYRSFFYVDSECLCRLTTGDRNRLRVAKAFGEGKVGKAFMVVDQEKNQYIMKSINDIGQGRIDLSFITLNKEDKSPASGIAVRTQRDVLGFVAAGMDDFTNQTVIHLLLNLILEDCPNYVYQYDAFKCTNNGKIGGYNIMDIASSGDMAQYISKNPDNALDICEEAIRQLFPVMAYLKRSHIGFQHNDFKTRNVFVHVPEGGKPIFRLADFDKSAISWGNIRFFNDSMYYVDLPQIPYDGVIQKLASQVPTRVTNLVGKSIAPYTMYNPRGYYATYDLYTFLFSMLFDQNVYVKFTYEITGSFMHQVVDVMCGHQPKIMRTVAEYMEKTRKTTGDDLLSITNINGIMHKDNFAIRMDLNAMMKELKLHVYEPKNKLSVRAPWKKVNTSKSGRICLGKPDIPKGRCNTKQYKTMFGTYDYDNI